MTSESETRDGELDEMSAGAFREARDRCVCWTRVKGGGFGVGAGVTTAVLSRCCSREGVHAEMNLVFTFSLALYTLVNQQSVSFSAINISCLTTSLLIISVRL